jgi:hypothetical protein
MQVVLTRRSKRGKEYETLALEFYSHRGKLRLSTSASEGWSLAKGD